MILHALGTDWLKFPKLVGDVPGRPNRTIVTNIVPTCTEDLTTTAFDPWKYLVKNA